MDHVRSVAAANYHSFVVKEDGTLWYFGKGMCLGGEYSDTPQYSPVKIMEGARDVYTSWEHALAIKQDGSLWAWGYLDGQVGDVTYFVSPIKLMDNVKTAAAGNNMSTAVKEDGTLWVWSENHYDPMSEGVNSWKSEPVQLMDNVDKVAAVTYGFKINFAAIKKDGSMWMCYQKYSPDSKKRIYESQKFTDEVKEVALGSGHSLFIKKDNSLWAIGINWEGVFGNGINARKLSFLKVMDGVKEIGAVENKSYAIKTDDSLWVWGNFKSAPVKVLENVGKVFFGGNEDLFMAAKKDGSLWECGSSVVKVMENVKSVAIIYGCCFAVQQDGSLWGWGENSLGYLGDGTRESKDVPVKIMDGVKEVFAGDYTNIISVIKEDQSLWQWGHYYDNGERKDQYTPVKIMEDVTNYIAHSASYAIKK